MYCPGPDCRRNENLQDTRYWSLIEQQIDFSFTSSWVSIKDQQRSRSLTFQDWVCLQELILDVLVDPAVPGHGGDVLHHQLARLRLPGPALPSEDDGLVLAVVPEEVPGSVSQGVTERGKVRWELTTWVKLTCVEGAGWDSGSGTCLWHLECRGTASCTGWCSPSDLTRPSRITDISHYHSLSPGQTEADTD